MDSLPNELITSIFDFINLITDKRQFLKTSKFHNNLTMRSMLNYEKNYNIPHFIYQLNYCMEKFTLELCHDGYFNLIPDHYIRVSNITLISCAAYYNNMSLLELAISKGCFTCRVAEFGALGGHISVLQWCVDNKFSRSYMYSSAIRCGHLHILKWLQGQQHREFDITYPWMCNKAAEYGQLEILKFAREIGCPWNIHTYIYALRNGNEELIKYLVDNGCPTN